MLEVVRNSVRKAWQGEEKLWVLQFMKGNVEALLMGEQS
jgi:hypothetical protein